ncbi:MAG: arylsulfatase [Phenylobacterium sp.]|uniref:arylsulfatase n=1 Tax=Phenylobacterium sp. TaxID=1871053 RepID=UPI0027250D4B|nr:arylsulfatase [Phenylobacterium sp.]MDO8910387.1 arylsulfatase [Phenylobacterium sp.]MDP3102366.1 arylsulfatase [Phenylobacterium sp.]
MAAKIGATLADSTPYWPPQPTPPKGAPNILVVLFDDVGFSDFGCYGSPIKTPTIDALAADGLRYTGFHTTAMCSTTRAALLTGRNHHSVGMGCLSNFDSGFPGYRGKIAREAGTLPEMLKPHGYSTYMVGKWHATPLTETGPSGPFDGWPLGRGFDRFYGFMDAETDQFAPELVRDNTPIEQPTSYAEGYHLTADLVDQSIRFIADHQADAPDKPWLLWLAPAACHAPHQAPQHIIRQYDPVFEHGWDVEREQRLARQTAMGIVPPDTVMPDRNDGIRAWDDCLPDDKRVFTRLQSAFAGMLDHADRHLARLVAFLEEAGIKDDTLIVVMSDNGASQEGGPLGMVNAMGSYNLKFEPMAEKLARIDDIGGPDSHSNFPQGWAMASNTPLRRYKQNTHGGGIRDPLVISWKNGLAARGELRTQFAHVSDFTPTLLDILGLEPPQVIAGVPQMPLEGVSFAASLKDPSVPSKAKSQHFEMFGHRGLWKDGWKAVAFHPPGTPFDTDVWELYRLDADFSETRDLAAAEPEKLAALVAEWWKAAETYKVLPLDDRFGPRFAENALRYHGARKRFVFHPGMGHLPADVAPDVRSRSYVIEAEAVIPPGGADGVLLAHGDATCGYSFYVQDGRLHHTLNVGGALATVSSAEPIAPGLRKLALRCRQGSDGRTFTLAIDGRVAGEVKTHIGFATFISWSGLDIGRDRGSPVAPYAAPFTFTGKLRRVVVTMDADQDLDGELLGEAEMARQ